MFVAGFAGKDQVSSMELADIFTILLEKNWLQQLGDHGVFERALQGYGVKMLEYIRQG